MNLLYEIIVLYFFGLSIHWLGGIFENLTIIWCILLRSKLRSFFDRSWTACIHDWLFSCSSCLWHFLWHLFENIRIHLYFSSGLQVVTVYPQTLSSTTHQLKSRQILTINCPYSKQQHNNKLEISYIPSTTRQLKSAYQIPIK